MPAGWNGCPPMSTRGGGRGEWDGSLWLFTGDLDSDRTAAWRCRTPGCPTPTTSHNGRCYSCRRSRSAAGVLRGGVRPPAPAPPDPPCRPEPLRGDRLPGRTALPRPVFSPRAGLAPREQGPVEEFIAEPSRWRDRVLCGGGLRPRTVTTGRCAVPRQSAAASTQLRSLPAEDWRRGSPARSRGSEAPVLVGRPAAAGAPRAPLRAATPRRDSTSAGPAAGTDPLSRLAGAVSVRHADPEAVCESGGVQYNSAIHGLFRDLRRHLERAWIPTPAPTPMPATCGSRRCWTCSPTVHAAGRLSRGPSTSARSSSHGCAR